MWLANVTSVRGRDVTTEALLLLTATATCCAANLLNIMHHHKPSVELHRAAEDALGAIKFRISCLEFRRPRRIMGVGGGDGVES